MKSIEKMAAVDNFAETIGVASIKSSPNLMLEYKKLVIAYCREQMSDLRTHSPKEIAAALREYGDSRNGKMDEELVSLFQGVMDQITILDMKNESEKAYD